MRLGVETGARTRMLGCVGTPDNVTSVYGSITGAQIELARKVVAVRRALTPDYRRVFDAMRLAGRGSDVWHETSLHL